ncbi:5'-nucleotidase C-terminal domain-containing protein [Plebeiibacterium sediminum]|uniref:5'-nucleotidase C-terminal domain-containing protein n=1 Tax=Plebeiibacterium sediminum TaxID=2992112 RepID=A0AAE3M361_9BACT|nr:5'-nucleotidase [Plebeiobacterium sediminum]MCW3786269.1 5'-nucleotidase C-terminal domain-containing protein [Plebeiobacterium sediminum]
MILKSKVIYILLWSALMFGCRQNIELKSTSGKLVLVDSSIAADSAVASVISPFREEIDKQMSRIIGFSEAEQDSYYPESPLSNFVSDIIQERALRYLKANNADTLPMISLMNIKGLRANLPEGEVTVRDIFEIMPFENQIVVLTISGTNIKAFFDYISTTNGEGISGAQLVIKNDKVKSVTINGDVLDVNRNYYLATSDYLANGGDYFSMITNPIQSQLIGCKIREAIIEHIEELNQNNLKVVSNIDGRIKID